MYQGNTSRRASPAMVRTRRAPARQSGAAAWNAAAAARTAPNAPVSLLPAASPAKIPASTEDDDGAPTSGRVAHSNASDVKQARPRSMNADVDSQVKIA